MTEPKGLGSKLLGIFVESDEEAGSRPDEPAVDPEGKSAADTVAELAGQAAAAARGTSPPPAFQPREPAAKPIAEAGGFDVVFRDAGLDAAELDYVKKAEELLRGLPDSTPLPVKKQIVEASLRAFGFQVEKIITAAHNQKRALDAYVKVNETATAKGLQESTAQIRSLEEKIAALRGDIDRRASAQTQLQSAAQARKAEVDRVLQFFQGPGAPGRPPAS